MITSPLLMSLALLFLSQTPAAPQQGTCEIRGRITDKETGRPLPRALVRVMMVAGETERATSTDDEGRYQFTDLPPGIYGLIAGAGQFRATHLMQTLDDVTRGAGRLTLKDGEVRADVNIALPRALALPVRVVDEWGEPLSGVSVQVTSADTRRNVYPGFSRATDDRGLLRVFPLAPGRYIVCAEPAYAMGYLGETKTGRRERFLRTCRPSGGTDGDFEPVAVMGANVPEVELRMRRGTTFIISGTVIDAAGSVASDARVSLSRFERGGQPRPASSSAPTVAF
jgi:Carboxypeptidase regulatory-like domain